jgi:hypothetical protein
VTLCYRLQITADASDVVAPGNSRGNRSGAASLPLDNGDSGGLPLDIDRQLSATQPISDDSGGGLSLDGGRLLSATQLMSSGGGADSGLPLDSGDGGGLPLAGDRQLSATQPIRGIGGGGGGISLDGSSHLSATQPMSSGRGGADPGLPLDSRDGGDLPLASDRQLITTQPISDDGGGGGGLTLDGGCRLSAVQPMSMGLGGDSGDLPLDSGDGRGLPLAGDCQLSATQPTSGLPVVAFLHGTGGDSESLVDRHLVPLAARG